MLKRVTEIANKTERMNVGGAAIVILTKEDYDDLIGIAHSGLAAEMALEKISMRVDQPSASEQKSKEFPHTKMNPEDLLSQQEVATEWGITGKALEKWRLTGEGPKYIKLGKGPGARVRYRRRDIAEFVTGLERKHTTEDTYIRKQEKTR